MQNLLPTTLTEFQAEILFCLQIAEKQISVGIDISTFDAGDGIDDDYFVHLNNVAFYQNEDQTWSSRLRVMTPDDEDGSYESLEDGERLVEAEKSPSGLVFRTLREMATFNLSMALEYGYERREMELETYEPCRKRFDSDVAYCGCWRCRHLCCASPIGVPCQMCRSIGRQKAENKKYEYEEIPY